jgi:hypothetical protein
MDADEEELSGRRRRRAWIGVLLAVALIGAMAAGAWFFRAKERAAAERDLVEQATERARRCVAALRADAPEDWSLARALEQVSCNERLARLDASGPEAERFAQQARAIADSCGDLAAVVDRARAEAPELYLGVPRALGGRPTEPHDRWLRTVLPSSRADVDDLARLTSAMQDALSARRAEHALMPVELPTAGSSAPGIARQIELAPLPREHADTPRTLAWPLPERVVVLRRGAIARGTCDSRFVNRLSCLGDYVQELSWSGAASPARALVRPESVAFWADFAPTPDGSIWALGADRFGRGVVGRYAPEQDTPELSPIAAAVDGTSSIREVPAGVAAFPSDGSVWASSGSLPLERTTEPMPPVVLDPPVDDLADAPGPARGIAVEGVGTVQVLGSEQLGFIARRSAAEQPSLVRLFEPQSRVRAVTELRARADGRTVALLRRQEASPDAVALSTDFGATWVEATAAAGTGASR